MSIPAIPGSAIVLGTEVNGLGVIRSLGRINVRCAAVCAPARGDPARFSRYLAFTREIPLDAPDGIYIQALRQIAGRLQRLPVVLIPTTDRYSELLARNEDQIRRDFLVCNPARSVCDMFLDKWSTAELCKRNDILIPFTACPETSAELERLASEVEYPVIVKPRYTFGNLFPGKNAVFDCRDELLAFFRSHRLFGHCVVQKIIPSGDGDILVTASYSSDKGRVQALYSGRKIRQYLPDYGATCFGLSERHPDLEAITRILLESIGYNGFAALEFARSRVDGRTYFLELNTRTYYHNQLFADAGVDLTQIGYLSAIGQDFATLFGAPTQRDGLVWLDFRRDYRSMRIKRRAGQITLAAWLHSLVTARSFAVWNWRDPRPFVMACTHRVSELARKIQRRVGGGRTRPTGDLRS
jgi:D-aspartate ligase